MLTGGARWHDDGVEGRKVLRLAYTTNGPLGSHHDIKKGHRECGAVAHRGGGIGGGATRRGSTPFREGQC
jgi:hypothetical protein